MSSSFKYTQNQRKNQLKRTFPPRRPLKHDKFGENNTRNGSWGGGVFVFFE